MIGPRLTLHSMILLTLSGCATTSQESISVIVDAQPTPVVTAAPKQKIPETPIPSESLFPLLEAEFALRARDFDRGMVLLADEAVRLSDPALARRSLRLAEFLNDADRATAMAIRLSELDPSDGAAAAAAAGWLSRTSNTVLALRYAELAMSLGQSVNVAASLGNYEQLDNDSQAAVAEAIGGMVERWPADDQVAIAASLLARLEKNYSLAMSLLQPVLERSPADTRAVMLWTQVQLDTSANDPFKRLRNAVEAYPGNQELRLQYARLLGSEKDYVGAQAQFSVLLEQEPDNPELLSTAALLDFELSDYDAALAKFRDLLAIDARVNEAYYYVGRIELEREHYPDAIASFAAVGPSREFRDAKARAAELLAETAFASDIKAFFEEQRRQFPSAAEQLFLLEANALRDWEGESLKTYDRGLIALPDSFSLLYGRAMVYESEGAFGAMETDLRSILAQDPDHAATLNALGYTLTNHTQRYEEAAGLIERALSLSPNDPAILDSLGWVYYKLGQYSQSELLLRRAHTAFPDPEVAAHLGEVLWLLGRHFEAKDIWHDGLSRVPDHPIILEAINRLGAELPK
ncbi:MAG: tetratricopeptide repeat protein [Luminiphilus sp.]|jgi:tetratricopeptide (TPR) repeat protein|nr:tetratricopeptide repeat protein [Luminiphilus sp.]